MILKKIGLACLLALYTTTNLAAHGFTLLCHSKGPQPTSGEPQFDLFKGPDKLLYPVLFIENRDPQKNMPTELADPQLYYSPQKLFNEAKVTHDAYKQLAGGNILQALHAAHTVACARIIRLKESIKTLVTRKEDGYPDSDPQVYALQLLIAAQARTINPLEVALLRELIHRHTYPHDKDAKTPLLNMMELGSE